MGRESFKSRMGFILVSAGCAIGIGNVWRFPYVAGQNGGGIFVLFYLIFLIAMGLPVLTMELAVGRASRKSAVLGYKALEKPNSKWHIHGWVAIFGCYMLMMYYTTVSGWMVTYFYKFVKGEFTPRMDAEQTGAVFSNLLADPKQMAFWMILTVVVGFFVCSRGLQNGLEKISKVMMSALLILIIVLAVHSLTLSGAGEGLKFYLVPNMDSVREVGLKNVITSAMNQAFFTLSLGVAAMEIFGSYMGKDHTLAGEGVRICALDTFVAIMAGLIIFPAAFSVGIQPDAGPSLIFITLPNVFQQAFSGVPILAYIFSVMFYVLLALAALTSTISLHEVVTAFLHEEFNLTRGRAARLVTFGCIIIGVISSLSLGVMQKYTLFDKGLFDLLDFVTAKIMLPLGGLLVCIFVGWYLKRSVSYEELTNGGKLKAGLFNLYIFLLRYVAPVAIILIFINELGLI